jgi:hypothetical protein
MDRINMRFLRDTNDNLVDIEIGSNRLLTFAHKVGLVCLKTVQGELVFVGIDGDGTDAQF